MAFLIRRRLRWLRFVGYDLGAPTLGHIIQTFQERPMGSSAMDEMSGAFCEDIRRAKPQSC